MHGPFPPPQILGGPFSQSPLGLRPCMHAIFKLGFELFGRGNCPSWEGDLSGGLIVRGVNCPGGNVRSPVSVYFGSI